MVAVNRVSAAVALAVALAFPGAAAAGGNLFANGSFEGTLSGWGGSVATLSLARDGVVGSGAARVAFSGRGTSFSIVPGPRPVRSTVAGTTYSAGGWLRSATPGRKVCLRVREWSSRNGLLAAADGCTTSTSSWQQLPQVSYTTRASGGSLDAYVYELGAARGDSFEVDGLALATGAGPAPASPPRDTTPPVATITAAPSGTVTTSSASISFTSEPGATFSCSLDRSAWRACKSPVSYSSLANGVHAFAVRATDAAGNVQPTPATATWSVSVLLPAPSWTPTWLNPFAPRSRWNTPLPANPVLDPESAAKASYFASTSVVNPNVALHAWTTTVAVATPSSKLYDVPCTLYHCTLQAYGPIPIPAGAVADSTSDGHLTIWDPATHHEWDLWQAVYDPSTDRWSASAGAAISTDTDGITPAGTAAGNAANFPMLGGLLRPEDIAQGHVDHALMIGIPNVASGAPACPATHNAGSNTSPYALPEGTQLQLDPSIDVASLGVPAWEVPILKAMQRYGMYVRDGGGSLAVYAENPANRGTDAWAAVGMSTTGGSIRLTGVPWASVRVIAAPRYPSC